MKMSNDQVSIWALIVSLSLDTGGMSSGQSSLASAISSDKIRHALYGIWSLSTAPAIKTCW